MEEWNSEELDRIYNIIGMGDYLDGEMVYSVTLAYPSPWNHLSEPTLTVYTMAGGYTTMGSVIVPVLEKREYKVGKGLSSFLVNNVVEKVTRHRVIRVMKKNA